ncbi:MAG: 4'-phosphopantetheinyl transferase family protein [Planctomycetota bacterium]|jgi:phosphopantetheinyl transferase
MVAKDIALQPLPPFDQHVEVSLLDLARLTDTESAAARFLTPREREEYGRLRHPARRQKWLGARVCLKEMLVRRGSLGDPMQCEIIKDGRGRPRLSFQPGLPWTAVHDCSLSHKARFACACASSKARTRVGVDIERISPRLTRLASAFVNDRDSLLRSRPPEVQLTVLWSLKEACSKAVGLGIGTGLADVICEETVEGRHRVRIKDSPVLQARHLVYEGYVIALGLMREENKEP